MVNGEFMVVGENEFLGLRGFWNVRNVYDWKSSKLKVGKIDFDFETLYEIECESVDHEKAKHILEGFLWNYAFAVDYLIIKIVRFKDVVHMSLILTYV